MAANDKPRRPARGFADLVGPVRRLHHDTVEFDRPKPPPRRRKQEAAAATLPDTFGDHAAQNAAPEFRRNGVQNSVLQKLRRGRFPVEDEVDLHGLDSNQARAHLAAFLDFARRERMSCVRVIHGKGFSSPGFKAVLKPRVRHWLREDPRVLAYVPAPPHAGGDGALYVLLRSREPAPRQP